MIKYEIKFTNWNAKIQIEGIKSPECHSAIAKNYKWGGPRTYCHRYPFSWSPGIWFLLIRYLSSLALHYHHIYSQYSILFHYHSSMMAKNEEKGNNSESNKLRHIYYFMLMFWTRSVIKGPVCALGSGKQDVKLKKPIAYRLSMSVPRTPLTVIQSLWNLCFATTS